MLDLHLSYTGRCFRLENGKRQVRGGLAGTHAKQSYGCLGRHVGGASTGPAIATNVRCDEQIHIFLQQLANLSAAATRARVLGGSNALCPLSGVITRSASGHARCRAHALSMGQTTS